MEVSASCNFSKLAHADDIARRRDGPAAAANLQGCTHSAAAFESGRSVTLALWACYSEVLDQKAHPKRQTERYG